MSNYFVDTYEGERLQAYKCPAGVWTISKGITVYPDGSKVKEGDIITKEYSDALVTDYFMKNITPIINSIGIKLGQKQREALGSLIFNIGGQAFKSSSLFKAIKNKDIKGIYKNWDWISAGNKALRGLAKRRAEELYWFMSEEL
jgi:lysozyme